MKLRIFLILGSFFFFFCVSHEIVNKVIAQCPNAGRGTSCFADETEVLIDPSAPTPTGNCCRHAANLQPNEIRFCCLSAIPATNCPGLEEIISVGACTDLEPTCFKQTTWASGNVCCCPQGTLNNLQSVNCGDSCSADSQCPARCPCQPIPWKGTSRWCSGSGIGLTPFPTIDIRGSCGPGQITTALGCISIGSNYEGFANWILKRVIGIAGGVAFLLVVFGGFKILTSAGDPKGVQTGSEMITSALIGLLFIIFSVFLLELIGVKILGIPGL